MQRNTLSIALAHDHLFQVGGAENVLCELARMYPEAPIYTLIYNKKNNTLFDPARIRTSMLQHVPGGVRLFKLYLRLMPLAWEQFNFSAYDVVLSSASGFVKGLITQPGTTHICYCHSPTRYLWSDHIEYMESLRIPGIAKLYLMNILKGLRMWDQLAAQRVDHFIANSQYVAKRIKKYYGRSSEVIYPPIDVKSFSVSQELGTYYLVVSRLRPYKRVDLVIEAFNHLRIPLVIIGGGEELPRLRRMAKANITFLGEVSNSKRNHYLAR